MTFFLLPLTGFLAVLAAPTVRGRLAETRAQIEARYGPVLSRTDVSGLPGAERCHYEHEGISITVTYIQGVCYAEAYAHLAGEPVSADEVRVLLEANSFGLIWLTIDQTLAAEKLAASRQPDLQFNPNSPDGWCLCDPKAGYAWCVTAAWKKANDKPNRTLEIISRSVGKYYDDVHGAQTKQTFKGF